MAYSPCGDIPIGLVADEEGFVTMTIGEANTGPALDLDGSFDIGDIVSLIVGGPGMVVIGVCECGNVEVAWTKVDGDVMVDVFPEEALIYV